MTGPLDHIQQELLFNDAPFSPVLLQLVITRLKLLTGSNHLHIDLFLEHIKQTLILLMKCAAGFCWITKATELLEFIIFFFKLLH